MATYSFLDVNAALSGPGGSFSIGSNSGAAEEGIDVEPSEDKNTMVIGADGTPMHSLHAGKPGKIVIRLLKTSPFNRQLDQMYNFQAQSSSSWGQNTLTIRDKARGDLITGHAVAFKKRTALKYGKDANVNEWEFDVGVLNELLGSGAPALG